MQLDWDPEIDSPATIAVIGGGPVGVEAALYARFLGYHVLLLDSRRIGSRLIRWGNTPLSVSFGNAASPLGLAALEAQDATDGLPATEARVTCRDYVEKYLIPVAKTDLLHDEVHINSPVVSISRAHWHPGRCATLQNRADDEFRIVVDSSARGEYSHLADIILDCSAEGRTPTGIGPGGGLAVGQRRHQQDFEVGIRDLLDRDRDRFVGKHCVMFGDDLTACYNAVQFMELAHQQADTKLTWILTQGTNQQVWLNKIRAQSSDLGNHLERLLSSDNQAVITMPAWGAESIERNESGRWQIHLLVGDEDQLLIEADTLLVTQTTNPWSLASGLSIDLCSHGRLTKSSAAWLASQSHNEELVVSLESCVTSEPHYYVLGRKSAGGDWRFSFKHARQQIQQLFALIGGRAELDLYQTVRPQIIS